MVWGQWYFCHLSCYPSHFTDRLPTYSLSLSKNSNLLISVVLLWTPCPEAEGQHCHDWFEVREGKKLLILEQPIPACSRCENTDMSLKFSSRMNVVVYIFETHILILKSSYETLVKSLINCKS